jgi:hypothetical protein
VVAPGELARLASLCSRLPDVSRGYRVDAPDGINVPRCGSRRAYRKEAAHHEHYHHCTGGKTRLGRITECPSTNILSLLNRL